MHASCLVVLGRLVVAAMPDHPIITEVYTDPEPAGSAGDGPIGRDLSNLHQEFIEIYLPTAADLASGLNKDALKLTFYEVEGDSGSSGYTLVNYRVDLPTFDLDISNGLTPGAVARPLSGVVVLGWVDYQGDPPTDLLGTPSTRVALINGGIISTKDTDYVFIALNGRQFSGTTNFQVPDPSNIDPDDALSLIHLPREAGSGIIQNGSSAYLLVDRDDIPGYAKLYDRKDGDQVPQSTCSCTPTSCDSSCVNANPDLEGGGVLETSALLDGLAGNDDNSFDILLQPMQEDPSIDLTAVLPEGGAYGELIPQVPENGGNGYVRLFGDVAKATTEGGDPGDVNAAVADALYAYRTISNLGPWYPTPGRATFTTSPAELSVADSSLQGFDVLAETTGRPGLIAANIGGNVAIEVTATPGASSDPSAVAFSAGDVVTVTTGQTLFHPNVAANVSAGAAHNALVTAPVSVDASKVNSGDPDIVNASWTTTLTVRVLNPTTGLDANGQPFETTVFAAIQGIVSDPKVDNEFLGTDLGAFLTAQPDIAALHTLGNGPALIDPLTDLNDPSIVRPMIKDLPDDDEECVTWLPRPGVEIPAGFADTVIQSAEVVSGARSYDDSISECDDQPVIKAIRVNVPDTRTFGGSFSPSERIHFVDPEGGVGVLGSGLTNATTSRTFEVALIDTNVKFDGSLETGLTDDFGIIVEVEETEAGAPVSDGDYIFLSFSGGLEGADIDSLTVPPGNTVANVILLDLDNLHEVLGIRSIEALFIVDAGASGNIDIIEGFSLHPAPPVDCTVGPDCNDFNVCTDDACDNNLCQYTDNTAPCDDGNPCTQFDQCNGAGACVGVPIKDCVACLPPAAAASGCRYVAVTPAAGTNPVGIRVTGDPADSDVSCVSLYVQQPESACVGGPLLRLTCATDADCPGGRCVTSAVLGPNRIQLTPAQWRTVQVRGAEIRPSSLYRIQADCGVAPGEVLSPAAEAATWLWGDVNHDAKCSGGSNQGNPCNRDAECPDGSCLGVSFTDIGKTVDGFKDIFSDTLTMEATDLVGCVPNRNVNFSDIGGAVDAFKSIAFTVRCAVPCGP